MADHSVPTEASAFELQFWRLAGQLRVCMPGNIVTFDESTQRCTIKPGIQMKMVDQGEASYMDLPDIQNVPIVVPYAQGAGVLLTLPIQAGDPCTILFSDRAMDNFLQRGETEIPGSATNADTTSPRMHHLTDAICIPGLITDNVVVPEWNTENIELRDFDRKHYFSLGPEGITISDSVATWNMKEGKVTLDAPAGIEETSEADVSRVTPAVNTLVGTNVAFGKDGEAAGMNEIQGSLKSRDGTFIDTNNRDSTGHGHSGVESGPSDTGPTAY